MQKKTRQIVGATKVRGLNILLPEEVSLKTLKAATRLGQRNLRAAKSKLLPITPETNIKKISTVLKSWHHIEARIGRELYVLQGDKGKVWINALVM